MLGKVEKFYIELTSQSTEIKIGILTLCDFIVRYSKYHLVQN